MDWQFHNDQPIYAQLVDQIKFAIVSGALGAGERMATVRDLALEAGVNPNTMQRALAALEADGLLITSRTAGRTVTTEEELIKKMKEQIAREEYERFYRSMRELGFEDEDIIRFVRETKVTDEKGENS